MVMLLTGSGLDRWMGCACPLKSRHQSSFPESSPGEESSSHSRNALFRCPSPWPATASCPRATVGTHDVSYFQCHFGTSFWEQSSALFRILCIFCVQAAPSLSSANHKRVFVAEPKNNSHPSDDPHIPSTEAFTHRLLYTQTLSHSTLSHTEALHRLFFVQRLLAFARSFHTFSCMLQRTDKSTN